MKVYVIAFAHANGVVHCDLKPENIMLGAWRGPRDGPGAAPRLTIDSEGRGLSKTTMGARLAYMALLNGARTDMIGPAAVYPLGYPLRDRHRQDVHAGRTPIECLHAARKRHRADRSVR